MWKFSLPILIYIRLYCWFESNWESETCSSNHWVNPHQKVSLELCSNPIDQSMCNRDKYCHCWVLNLGPLASTVNPALYRLTRPPARASRNPIYLYDSTTYVMLLMSITSVLFELIKKTLQSTGITYNDSLASIWFNLNMKGCANCSNL